MQYGINLNGRKGYNNLPTTEWVVKNWESKLDDDVEGNEGMIVQALWSGTDYFGCGDSYNAAEKCSVSVCLYAKVCLCLLCLLVSCVFYIWIEGSLLLLYSLYSNLSRLETATWVSTTAGRMPLSMDRGVDLVLPMYPTAKPIVQLS